MIKKYSLALVAFLCFVLSGFGQVAITPIRTDVTGFGTWTDNFVTGTTYVQLLRATSSTITPAMNFNLYTAETLDFSARTFGGTNATENTVTVSISEDDGGTWTVLGTRTPMDNNLNPQPQFDISSYNGTQVRIRFTVAGTSNTIGVGIDDITINGLPPSNPVDFCNLQSPATGNTTVGTVYDVYARVYEAGVTNPAGADPSISAWIGYNTVNNNPNTAAWTWIPATWNAQYGNDDEYVANIGTLPTLPSGTYYYASRFQIDSGAYRYGGLGGFWNLTARPSGVLSVDTVDFCSLEYPVAGSITLGDAFAVYGQVYEQGVTPGVGQGTGIDVEIGYSTSNTNPNTWTNWIPTAYNAACLDCNDVAGVIQNDEYSANLGGAITSPGTYYYATRFRLNSGAWLYGGILADESAGGFWNNSTYISGVLNVVNVPQCHTEDFSGLTSTATNYASRTWSGAGGIWTATDAREEQVITAGNKAITIRDGILTSPEFTDGIGSLTVTTLLKFTGSSGTFDLKVNGVTVGTIPYSTAVQTTTIPNINIPYEVVITLENNSTPASRVAFDDLSWTCYECPSPAADPTGTIAGDTPECNSTELTYSSPSATTFWQTVPNGHSMANPTTSPLEVTTSGTYYVNTFDGTCWSTNSIAYPVTINYSSIIDVQPVDQLATVGDNVTFSVTATNVTSYQWQESTDGITWTNVGTNASTFTLTNVQLSSDGYRYRVILTSATCGTLVSDIAILRIYDSNCINENFTSTTAPSGWTDNGTSNDSDPTHYLSGPNCRAFGTNDNMVTPAVDNPEVLQFYQDASGGGNGNTATIQYRIGGGPYVTFYSFIVTQAGQIETVDLTNLGGVDLSSNTNVTFRFRSTFNTWYLDNVKVFCTPCTNPTTISTISPSSGPEGTYVTINGSDFTAATTVQFNGIAATVDSWTATQLVVIVPTGATDGNIVISTLGICDSAIAFDVIDNDDLSCQATFGGSELFIYEIFDEDNNADGPPVDYGNGGMITILNPTLQTVNLNDYRLYRTGTVGSLPYAVWFSPSGTLAPGELYRIRVSASECTGYVSPYDDVVIGFNADDGFELRKFDSTSGTYQSIDQAYTPTYVGYYMLRDLNATNPSTTYTAGDWTITNIYNPPSNTTTCVPVGVTPAFSGSLPLINSFNVPASTCDTASIIITASEGYNETTPPDARQLNFEWYYYDGITDVWTLIITGGDYTITNTIDNATGVGSSTLDVVNVYDKVDYQYYCRVRENDASCYVASIATKLNISRTIWDGVSWTPSQPDSNSIAIVNADYDTSVNVNGETSFIACTLIVNSGATLTVANGDYVEVINDVIVNGIDAANFGEIQVETQASFVQRGTLTDAGTFTLNGTARSLVSKYTAPLQEVYDYTYWSSPVLNPAANVALFGSNAGRRFWFNAANYLDVDGDDIDDNANDWTVIAGVTDPYNTMTPGRGYASTHSGVGFTPNTSYQYIFEGALNTGDITYPLFYNAANTTDHWNLVGNPYPSAIDVDELFAVNSSMKDVVYLWSHFRAPEETNPGNEVLNFNQNDYLIINATIEIGNGSDLNGDGTINGLDIPERAIPSGQSFFVSSLSANPIVFNNDMRLSGDNANDDFYRVNQSSNVIEDRNKIWINMTSDNGAYSQTGIGYVPGATSGYDGMGYDAKRNSSYVNAAIIYSIIPEVQDMKLAIQGKHTNDLSLDEVVRLGFLTNLSSPTTYRINLLKTTGEFLADNTVFLKDNLLNITHNLTGSEYVFSSETGEFNTRFEIVFRDQALSVIENEIPASGLSIVELTSGEVKFSVASNLDIRSVEIIDMLGRTLYQLKGDSPSELYNLSNLSQAAYIAKVTLSNGQVITKRAVKKY